MNVTDALHNVHTLFLDTAPIVYLLEKNIIYFERAYTIFQAIDTYQIVAVTSPITLAECTVMPFRQRNEDLKRAFVNFIVHSENTRFMVISEQTGLLAAELRGRYNLGLPDALQVATAINAGCDAFLSNDKQLKRISELKVLVLDELTA